VSVGWSKNIFVDNLQTDYSTQTKDTFVAANAGKDFGSWTISADISVTKSTNLILPENSQNKDLGLSIGWSNEALQVNTTLSQNTASNEPTTYRTRTRKFDVSVMWQVAGLVPMDISVTASYEVNADRLANINEVSSEAYMTLSMPLELN
jgi:hypothetical protein